MRSRDAYEAGDAVYKLTLASHIEESNLQITESLQAASGQLYAAMMLVAETCGIPDETTREELSTRLSGSSENIVREIYSAAQRRLTRDADAKAAANSARSNEASRVDQERLEGAVDAMLRNGRGLRARRSPRRG